MGPIIKMITGYNWDIANDTFVPLPDPISEAIWRIAYLDWLEWFKDDYIYFNYVPYSIMGIGGHC